MPGNSRNRCSTNIGCFVQEKQQRKVNIVVMCEVFTKRWLIILMALTVHKITTDMRLPVLPAMPGQWLVQSSGVRYCYTFVCYLCVKNGGGYRHHIATIQNATQQGLWHSLSQMGDAGECYV